MFSAGFSLTSNSLVGDKKIQMYHHYIEAAKFANGQKRNIRDPAFNKRKVRKQNSSFLLITVMSSTLNSSCRLYKKLVNSRLKL